MNRFPVHLNVVDLDASIRLYSELFAAGQAARQHDYGCCAPASGCC